MITIRLDEQTSQRLSQARYSLYVFRAVDIINAAALPTVWCRVAEPLLQEIRLTWETSVSAFISTTEVVPGQVIVSGYSAPMERAQTLRIEAGQRTVVHEGSPDGIAFDNRTSAGVTCGIAQAVKGHATPPTPLCAFPVGPHTEQGVRPADAILLLFSTALMEHGTVVADPNPLRSIVAGGHTAFANQTQGVLVTGTIHDRTVMYSHETGLWTWDDGGWATRVKPSDAIVPILIRSSLIRSS